MDPFLDILNDWERNIGYPFVFNHLDSLIPSMEFKLFSSGDKNAHWGSRFKINGMRPKKPNAQKTVVYGDLKIHENGDWDNPIHALDWLKNSYGLSTRYQVFKKLSEDYNLNIPSPTSSSVVEVVSKRERRQYVLNLLNDYFRWNLMNNSSRKAAHVRAYLKRKRGFNERAIEELGFGFAPSWSKVIGYMGSKSVSKQELEAACLVTNNEGNTMVGASHILTIPYVVSGDIKGFIFRCVDEGKGPKYFANYGLDRKSAFFNIPSGHVEDLLIVEGEFDALTATAAGIPSAVSIGGSEISGERRKQIEDALHKGVTQIYLCLDLDTIEQDGVVTPNYDKRFRCVMKTINTIQSVNIDIQDIFVVCFDNPSDPDEFIRTNGRDAFIELLRNAKPWWEYVATYKTSGKA